jgi:hypothetical protein
MSIDVKELLLVPEQKKIYPKLEEAQYSKKTAESLT